MWRNQARPAEPACQLVEQSYTRGESIVADFVRQAVQRSTPPAKGLADESAPRARTWPSGSVPRTERNRFCRMPVPSPPGKVDAAGGTSAVFASAARGGSGLLRASCAEALCQRAEGRLLRQRRARPALRARRRPSLPRPLSAPTRRVNWLQSQPYRQDDDSTRHHPLTNRAKPAPDHDVRLTKKPGSIAALVVDCRLLRNLVFLILFRGIEPGTSGGPSQHSCRRARALEAAG